MVTLVFTSRESNKLPDSLAETIYQWRHNSKIAKKFDGGKSAHVLLKGRPIHSKDDTDQFGLY